MEAILHFHAIYMVVFNLLGNMQAQLSQRPRGPP